MSAEFLKQTVSVLDGQVAVVIGGTGVLGGALVRRPGCRPGATSSSPDAAKSAGNERVAAIEAAGGQGQLSPTSTPPIVASIQTLLAAIRLSCMAASICWSTAPA